MNYSSLPLLSAAALQWEKGFFLLLFSSFCYFFSLVLRKKAEAAA